jgi:hypothetical protein
MTNYVYIDVPHEFELDWELIPLAQRPALHAAEHVMTVVTGYPTKFIRNSGAKLSQGDVYKVSFKKQEDETFFILKTPFKIVNKQVVDDYLTKEELKRIKHYETYSRNPRC